jgi:hypothetical protein
MKLDFFPDTKESLKKKKRKEIQRPIFLMNIEIPQQNITKQNSTANEKIIHHDQIGFILGISKYAKYENL